MKTTKYTVYASWDDAIRLVRKAKKAGYSYVNVEPYDNSNPSISVNQKKKVQRTIEVEPSRWAMSTEFGCKVFIPAKRETVTVNNGATLATNNYKRSGRESYLPKTLVYRQYSDRTVSQPDFELFKVDLVREY